MRIQIVVQKLTGGGAEHVAALWTRGFVERGHQVSIILCCPKNTPITFSIPASVRIYCIYQKITYQLYSRFHIDKYQVYKYRKIIKKERPDVIIGVLQPFTEWARKASVGMNIPIINTEHNTFEVPCDAPVWRKKIVEQKYKLNHNYQQVTVLTNADKRCADYYFNNITVLPNPLAYQPLDFVPPKKKIILAAGRLDVWQIKGFDLLIDAWCQIAGQYPDWKLCIAGQDNNNAQDYLESMINENAKGQVEFLGFRKDMVEIYQQASIFVLSSRYEGFGLVLIEAMSQGCAPIACDFKGRQSEIITSHKEGIICPVDDIKSLVDAMKKMIEDNKYREDVQKNAIERSRYYGLENTMDKWDQIFKKIHIKER